MSTSQHGKPPKPAQQSARPPDIADKSGSARSRGPDSLRGAHQGSTGQRDKHDR